MRETIFVSSAQKEFAAERQAVRDFVRGDPLLRQYFDAFLFEDLPATSQSPDQVYIGEVDRCGVYLGIFGNEYGWEDAEGLSPTEREFDRATLRRKPRFVFVRGADDSARHSRMKALIRKAEHQLVRRRFVGTPDLTGKIFASLVHYLEQRGVISSRPFHAAPCHAARLADIDAAKLRWFIQRAREERQLALNAKADPEAALTSLNLLAGGKPTNAAVLLFGADPQKFLPAAEVKCLHFHGTTVAKPIPSYKVFKGTLFDQVDEAVDFVMSKLARAVGTRQAGPAAPVDYEMPRAVVTEAVVNAVAHRDYASAAAIQVYVFADRVEVWNPGELPPSLTPESLRQQHPSLPHNPLIAEQLFLAHYIEKVGTGTLDVIAGCRAVDLPEPEFFQDGDQFVIRLWRDWLTADFFAGLALNARQAAAVATIRQQRRIKTGEYQRVTGTTRATAKRDLETLVGKGLLIPTGAGRGACYELPKKRLINDSIGSSAPAAGIGSETAQTAHRARPKRANNVPIVPSARRGVIAGTETARPTPRARKSKRDLKGTNGTSNLPKAKRATKGPKGPATGKAGPKNAKKPGRKGKRK